MVTYLIGLPASGKTTLGEALHCATGIPFIDLDRAVEQAEGMAIPQIFATRGEEAFRQAESRELKRLSTLDTAIVACGGGTPCREENLQLMLDTGRVIRLVADTGRLVKRLLDADGTRPLTAGLDAAALRRYVEQTEARRNPYYQRAQHSFDTTHLDTPAEVADTVKRFLGTFML